MTYWLDQSSTACRIFVKWLLSETASYIHWAQISATCIRMCPVIIRWELALLSCVGSSSIQFSSITIRSESRRSSACSMRQNSAPSSIKWPTRSQDVLKGVPECAAGKDSKLLFPHFDQFHFDDWWLLCIESLEFCGTAEFEILDCDVRKSYIW